MRRRKFLGFTTAALLTARAAVRGATGPSTLSATTEPTIMTVRGPVAAAQLGLVLPHEHVLVDFVGAAEITPARYDAEVAFAKIKPFLDEARGLGCRTLFECTPAFLGRDPRLLVRLSGATGLHLVTNTGYYSARQNKFLPAHALTENAAELAARWQREWADGIDGTGIRPGFIKIGVDAGPLTPAGRTLAQAAARTHRATGLTIAAHTGDQVAALAQLAVHREEGVHPSAWIWVHAQNAKDPAALTTAARAGAWLSFDGIAPQSLARHVAAVVDLRRQGFLDQLLVSHDAGWYRPGEPDGGKFRGFDALFRAFLPALRREGFTAAEIARLTVANPARAFTIRVRITGGG
jgi:phosphotriesterase-related protein